MWTDKWQQILSNFKYSSNTKCESISFSNRYHKRGSSSYSFLFLHCTVFTQRLLNETQSTQTKNYFTLKWLNSISTTTPVYQYTSVPLYQCTSIPVYQDTSVISLTCYCVLACPIHSGTLVLYFQICLFHWDHKDHHKIMNHETPSIST